MEIALARPVAQLPTGPSWASSVRGWLRGGGEVVVTVLDLEFQVDDLLFECGDPGLELSGVVGTADTGLSPDLLARAGEWSGR
ncbi:hypothetical protein [Streptomyces acidicola]|uniref:Uncharacterized protein n=1 Tax=Streptomyces acidicola TaxID=2596892 RepID=A0A5N8WSY0_9ACTN|nr:hypothetical protein [Streptomyces acidicola]MPY49335.1 hypothetical protein [Streptomyces acidicola]